ncbi:Acyl-CoA synthetase (AMP-forming)/AMP-acid ligase II [Trujillonella endophytica]|uniref:Acyl-CoA synthetase (AMP-forming)/AMP-acid ligase II n=2 Tax=Trujillonella endophytica TaxID=673521 RepID=A0A1H8VXA5_9ACTN|nr:Acyl-CoA synthetase (AMP-forming)/AMP-acid ligase II [Trujillella endophytica]
MDALTATERTIPQMLFAGAERYADSLAVADGDVRLTYAQLRDRALEFGRGALALGVRRGDRVGLWAPNTHRWVVASLGLHLAGATVVPLNTRYRGSEAREILARVRARFVVVQSGFLGYDYATAALEALDGDESVLDDLTVVDLGAERGDVERGVLGWEDLRERAATVPEDEIRRAAAEVEPDDLSEIIFTSGTTGRPKGVLIPHGPALDLYATYAQVWGLREGDRYLVVLPFFHTGGNKAGMIVSLQHGLTVVPMAVFDADEALRLIETERISIMNGSPTIYYALLESPRRESTDLSSLRRAATGAAVVPVALIERSRVDLPFERLVTAYGMTECIGTATMCRDDDGDEVIANTNGRAVPGVELRVVDREGRDLPPGESGEVLIRGANVTPGYWEDPDATAAAIDADGWLHSGDIGHLDATGNLKITDRLKDMFIVGGFNVSPAEVEQVLARHPLVSEVAVVGVPDDRLGEVPRAYVVRRRGAEGTAEELIGWAKERLANFKVPRSVEFADDLPRNASGKVLKRELRSAVGG